MEWSTFYVVHASYYTPRGLAASVLQAHAAGADVLLCDALRRTRGVLLPFDLSPLYVVELPGLPWSRAEPC